MAKPARLFSPAMLIFNDIVISDCFRLFSFYLKIKDDFFWPMLLSQFCVIFVPSFCFVIGTDSTTSEKIILDSDGKCERQILISFLHPIT